MVQTRSRSSRSSTPRGTNKKARIALAASDGEESSVQELDTLSDSDYSNYSDEISPPQTTISKPFLLNILILHLESFGSTTA